MKQSEALERVETGEQSSRVYRQRRFSTENEDKKKPLTDDQLTKLLNKKGYPIARRTVAKYREMIGAPVARLRKKL